MTVQKRSFPVWIKEGVAVATAVLLLDSFLCPSPAQSTAAATKGEIATLRKLLADPEAAKREGAAHRLGAIGPAAKDAISELFSAFVDDQPFELELPHAKQARHAVGTALLKIGDEHLVLGCLEHLRPLNPVNPSSSTQADLTELMISAYKPGNLKIDRAVCESLEVSKNTPVSLAAMSLIQKKAKMKLALEPLVKLTTHPDAWVSQQAYRTIASFGPDGTETIPALKKLYEDRKTRILCLLEALGSVGRKDEKVTAYLRAILTNKKASPSDRLWAAHGLSYSEFGRPIVSDLLNVVVESHPADDEDAMEPLRMAALAAIKEIRPGKKDLPTLFLVHQTFFDKNNRYDEICADIAGQAIAKADPDGKDAIPWILTAMDNLPDDAWGDERFYRYTLMLRDIAGTDVNSVLRAHSKVSSTPVGRKRFSKFVGP